MMDRMMFGASQVCRDEGLVKMNPMKPLEETAKNTADLNRQIEELRRELREHIEKENQRREAEEQQRRKERRKSFIRWLIPTAISLMAFLFSVLTWLHPLA